MQLALAPIALQARRDAHVSYINLASNSFRKPDRSKRITVRAVITATPVSDQSRVVLRNTTLAASGRMYFDIIPHDNIGLRILNAPDVTYQTKLLNAQGEGKHTTCIVLDYVGECELPGLRAGAFILEVLDGNDEPVGGGDGRFNFSVLSCPETYILDNDDSTCKCDLGQFDAGAMCLSCPDGEIADERGLVRCVACVFPEMSNANRTKCSECQETYYRDDTETELCLDCGETVAAQRRWITSLGVRSSAVGGHVGPGAVTCAARSRIQDWQLSPGMWRPGPLSTDVRKCQYGKSACPGNVSVDGANYCAEGYKGILCAACDTRYFRAWTNNGCAECAKGESHVPTIILSVVVFIVLLPMIGFCFVRSKIGQTFVADTLKQLIKIGETKGKLGFFCAQIISEFAAISKSTGESGGTYPDPASTIASVLDAANLDVLGFVPWGCVLPSVGFYQVTAYLASQTLFESLN